MSRHTVNLLKVMDIKPDERDDCDLIPTPPPTRPGITTTWGKNKNKNKRKKWKW